MTARRRGLIPAQCWRDAWDEALVTVGVLACAPVAWFVIRGIAVLTRPFGLLLLQLASGGH